MRLQPDFSQAEKRESLIFLGTLQALSFRHLPSWREGVVNQSLEFEVWVVFVSVSVLGFQPSEIESVWGGERRGGGERERGRVGERGESCLLYISPSPRDA